MAPKHLVWKVKKNSVSLDACQVWINQPTLVLFLKIKLISYSCNISIWHFKNFILKTKNRYYSICVHLENDMMKRCIWITHPNMCWCSVKSCHEAQRGCSWRLDAKDRISGTKLFGTPGALLSPCSWCKEEIYQLNVLK